MDHSAFLFNPTVIETKNETQLVDEHEYREGEGFTPQSTVHLLTGAILMFLAIPIIILNIMMSNKRQDRSKIFPHLQKESRGPFSSTRISSDGSIVPTVLYLNETVSFKQIRTMNEKPTVDETRRNSTRFQDILSVLDLLEEGTGEEKKIITEEKSPKAREVAKTTHVSDIEKRSISPTYLSNIVSTPLSPAYHATRKVSKVWDMELGVENLYTQIHRL